MRIELSRCISQDLEAIADYVAQDSPQQALKLIRRIRLKLRQIEKNPQLYQLRPDIGEGARAAVVGRYVILFRVVGDAVRVERVVFGGRDLPPLIQ
jgi:toxin ParE1/3/4